MINALCNWRKLLNLFCRTEKDRSTQLTGVILVLGCYGTPDSFPWLI